MYTKLDKPASPPVEEALTPYEKTARLLLAFGLAGKLGPFDPADQAAYAALDKEVETHEAGLEKAAARRAAEAAPKPPTVTEPPKPPAKA